MSGEKPQPSTHEPRLGQILVVENDPHYADMVARILAPKFGFPTVVLTRSLAGALDCFRQNHFALVFLDLNLSDSRGLDTLARVQNHAQDAHILVMASEVDESLAIQAMRNGAQDYLTKGHLTPDAFRRLARYAMERYRSSQTLRESRALLSATLDALPSCVGLLGADGRLEVLNERWRRYVNPDNPLIHGCEAGVDYLSTAIEFWSCLGIDGARGAHLIQEIATGGRDYVAMDYAVPHFSGQCWFELKIARFTAWSEAYLVVSHTEITERKELEAQLLKTERLFTLISENVVDLMAIIDESGRRIYTSPSYAIQLGYSAAEMSDFSSLDLLHPDDRDSVHTALGSLFSKGTLNRLHYRLRKKDGSYAHFESNGGVVEAEQGCSRKALIVARDVTHRIASEMAREQMEVQLRHAQKLEAIGQLAAGIAHEINTPIQYVGDNTTFLGDIGRDVMAFLEHCQNALQDGGLTGKSASEIKANLEALEFDYLKKEMPRAIQQSLDGVARVSKIVSAMKDFSHPGGATQESVDLNRAIESTITVSRNVWKYVATLEMDFEDQLPLVPCFPGEFNQVVLNLLVNAAHAIEEIQANTGNRELGLIRVSTRNLGEEVEIQVCDSGAGIPEKIRSRIFDPFFTTKAVGKGTGQGLSIAQSVIVQKHKGRIEVESEPGQGTCFHLFLPLKEVP